MISFIMPAKGVSLYIKDAIDALLPAAYQDWELIVIEDHSADDTLAILREIEKTDRRIKVFVNTGKGKVAGLNYGYTLANGEIVKCIDADDLLDMRFFDYLDEMVHHEATCHDGYVIKSNLKVMGRYSVDKSILGKDFIYCLRNLKGIPKWAWSFGRNIGDRIFPMPENLPFEDVWFSLIIKKYTDKIGYINKPLYYYRQHDNQTYGGILNFDSEVLAFRAGRMLKLIDVIKHEQSKRLIRDIEDEEFFNDIQIFYNLLADERAGLRHIVTSGITGELKLKLLVYKKLNRLAPSIIKLKWFLDKIR